MVADSIRRLTSRGRVKSLLNLGYKELPSRLHPFWLGGMPTGLGGGVHHCVLSSQNSSLPQASRSLYWDRRWRRLPVAQLALQIPTATQAFAIAPRVCARAQAKRVDRKGLLAPQTQIATRAFVIAPPVSARAEATIDRRVHPAPSTPTATRT